MKPAFVEWDPVTQVRRSYYEIEDGLLACKTEYVIDELLAANAEARAESKTAWGDGKIVASIPMNILMRDLLPAIKNGDDKHLAKFLNDIDNRAFRTREGRL
jgi:hypothetical protein